MPDENPNTNPVESIRRYLKQGKVFAEVGNRLWYHARPQGTLLPCVVLKRMSETHVHTISDRSGFCQTRIQLTVLAEKYLDADRIARDIYQSGVATVLGTSSDVKIRGVTIEDGVREYVIRDSRGGDELTYACEFDLMVSYVETIEV